MFQIPKGLFDILPYGAKHPWQLSHLWQYVEKIAKEIANIYGYLEIRTPIFERTDLFIRSSGQTSDIVQKEMYTFLDKAKRSMTLRPEGTACIIRALLENNLTSFPNPYKLFYIGPMFRYDRPQAGRYRQHHQFGIEAIGCDNYEMDAEVIDLLWQFYKKLNIKNLTLFINSIGDIESREQYKKALKEFLKPQLTTLSKESRERFETNPLRILDSKDTNDIEILKKAPSILEFLTPFAKNYFNSLCLCLKNLNIPFQINEKIVRGLDYYTHTIFEVVSQKKGAQNSLGGGGRFNGLVKKFKGPDLSAVGFGTGLERVIQTMLEQNVNVVDSNNTFIYFIPLDETSKEICFNLVSKLRHLDVPAQISFAKLQKALKVANNLNAKYCAILGENERKESKILIKNMQTHEQKSVSLQEFITYILNLRKQ